MRSTYHSTQAESKVYGFVAGLLLRHFPLADYGRTCPIAKLLAVWLLAAARRLSLSAASEQVEDGPSRETVRKATSFNLGSMSDLERCLNRALCDRLPKSLRSKRQIWAIDFMEQPYYGRSCGDGSDLRHGKPKRGATKFRTYASLYVVLRGARFTLSATYVWRSDTLCDVLERLITPVRKRGIFPRFLLLDREFYNLDVVQFLQRHRVPFLMPVVHRGRRAKDPSKAKGTQQFLSWRRSGRAEYTMKNGRRRAKVTILVAVDEPAQRRNKRRRGNPKPGPRVLVFAAWGFHARSTSWARETYRLRFGIESSYRQVHQAQAWTTSQRPDQRLLLVGLALLLRNAWVWLHRRLLFRWPRRAHLAQQRKLPLITLLIHLEHDILLLFGLTAFAISQADMRRVTWDTS
jgi:hypothetical protein